MHPLRPVPASAPSAGRASGRAALAPAALVAAFLLGACAATGPDGDDATTPARGAGAGRSGPPAAAEAPRRGQEAAREATETQRPSGKVDWVAVFESPPGSRYSEQRVIYVDRNSVQPQQLENLTYYVARTREVTRSGSKPKVQEIAVLCEGSPIAPATSLRAEGTEESNGSYSLKRSPTPLTSVNQFSTQRVRADPSNPTPFVVRAVCMLGTGG